MRVMRAIHEHRGDACGKALYFVFRAMFKNTGLISDLQHSEAVYKLDQHLGGRGSTLCFRHGPENER